VCGKDFKPWNYHQKFCFGEEDKKILSGLYYQQDLPAKRIAEIYSVDDATVAYWFKKLGIPIESDRYKRGLEIGRRPEYWSNEFKKWMGKGGGGRKNLNNLLAQHNEKAQSIVDYLKDKGYIVIPLTIMKIIPDIIAFKNDKVLLIEVTANKNRRETRNKIERYRKFQDLEAILVTDLNDAKRKLK
jgi:hypothetical protein